MTESKQEKAKKKAYKDVNKMKIETKAEGISALRARFQHWMKKLGDI